MPCIDETLDCLGGATIFTSLDLKSGYWQVEMEEESKPLTAFTVGPLGFYECEHVPFGLTNVPATFQHLMENCLGELHLSWYIIYLDDIIVFSDNPKEHLCWLRGVFTKLEKRALIKWTEECQAAFDKLKELCTSTPILTYANYKKPFQLQTDASDLGLGAVLYQRDDKNHQRVIAFASRSLSNTERNYPAHKLEFLALKWAITDRFHKYLYGGQFDVYTDNNPLTYILTSTRLDATGQRWVASLANYDFRIFYKSGKTNVEAEALSRIPRDGHTLIDTPTIKAVMTAIPSTDWSEYNFNPSEIVCKSTQIVVHKRTKDDWKIEQENDPIIGPVIEAMKNKSSNTSGFSDESRRLFRNRSRWLFRCGLLYRKVFDGQLQENKFQFILPKPYWK